MKYSIQILSAIAIMISLSSFTVTPPNMKWEKLGSRTVDYRLDKDIIHVGLKDGRFSKLKIAVEGGDINMHSMKVEYMNGQVEKINIKHNFSKRSASRTIDLLGRKRVIKNISFWYDTKSKSRRKAKVSIFGK